MVTTSPITPKFLSKPTEIGVTCVGFAGGQNKAGVDTGPAALIEYGLLTQLKQDLGYTVFGDGETNTYAEHIPSPENDKDHRGMQNPRAVSIVTQQLQEQVYAQAVKGRFALTLGGDHSIAIGTITGTARAIRERLGREIAVIWVDAHADINTPESSDSGHVHGMPVSFLTGIAEEKDETMFGWMSKYAPKTGDKLGGKIEGGGEGTGAATGVLSTKKLVYIGLRDVDRGEKEILRKYGIKAFSMHDVDKWGIGRVMELALAHIGSDTPIHLSFDVDALDPQWAPSTGTPVRGGLTLREGDYIAECVAETGSLVAMDLVEVNPSLEIIGAGETIRAGCSLVRCALGDTLL